MAATVPLRAPTAAPPPSTETLTESYWIRGALITFTLLFLILFLFLPLAAVFIEAFRKGSDLFFAAFKEADALSAIRLTFLAAGIAVPLNVVFGLAASWVIAKFSFPGKSLLLSLIDLPFAVSPVISGLV